MLVQLGKFVLAVTVGAIFEEAGHAIGRRLARRLDPVGAKLEELSVMAQLGQAGMLPEEDKPEPPKKRRKR